MHRTPDVHPSLKSLFDPSDGVCLNERLFIWNKLLRDIRASLGRLASVGAVILCALCFLFFIA
jgi:hypothetical protein